MLACRSGCNAAARRRRDRCGKCRVLTRFQGPVRQLRPSGSLSEQLKCTAERFSNYSTGRRQPTFGLIWRARAEDRGACERKRPVGLLYVNHRLDRRRQWTVSDCLLSQRKAARAVRCGLEPQVLAQPPKLVRRQLARSASSIIITHTHTTFFSRRLGRWLSLETLLSESCRMSPLASALRVKSGVGVAARGHLFAQTARQRESKRGGSAILTHKIYWFSGD